jgi:hypothetical protein
MDLWYSQRGEIQIGCIIGIIVLICVVLVAIRTVPVYTKIGEFEKSIENQADRANVPGNTDKKIRAAILRKAQDLALPVEDSHLKIKRSKSLITISVEYDQEIDYVVHVRRWRQVHKIERPLF